MAKQKKKKKKDGRIVVGTRDGGRIVIEESALDPQNETAERNLDATLNLVREGGYSPEETDVLRRSSRKARDSKSTVTPGVDAPVVEGLRDAKRALETISDVNKDPAAPEGAPLDVYLQGSQGMHNPIVGTGRLGSALMREVHGTGPEDVAGQTPDQWAPPPGERVSGDKYFRMKNLTPTPGNRTLFRYGPRPASETGRQLVETDVGPMPEDVAQEYFQQADELARKIATQKRQVQIYQDSNTPESRQKANEAQEVLDELTEQRKQQQKEFSERAGQETTVQDQFRTQLNDVMRKGSEVMEDLRSGHIKPAVAREQMRQLRARRDAIREAMRQQRRGEQKDAAQDTEGPSVARRQNDALMIEATDKYGTPEQRAALAASLMERYTMQSLPDGARELIARVAVEQGRPPRTAGDKTVLTPTEMKDVAEVLIRGSVDDMGPRDVDAAMGDFEAILKANDIAETMKTRYERFMQYGQAGGASEATLNRIWEAQLIRYGGGRLYNGWRRSQGLPEAATSDRTPSAPQAGGVGPQSSTQTGAQESGGDIAYMEPERREELYKARDELRGVIQNAENTEAMTVFAGMVWQLLKSDRHPAAKKQALAGVLSRINMDTLTKDERVTIQKWLRRLKIPKTATRPRTAQGLNAQLDAEEAVLSELDQDMTATETRLRE